MDYDQGILIYTRITIIVKVNFVKNYTFSASVPKNTRLPLYFSLPFFKMKIHFKYTCMYTRRQ